ncbi:MAG: hypothetical protein ACLFNQ_14095, partial [Spirochaetaceae bacterium]
MADSRKSSPDQNTPDPATGPKPRTTGRSAGDERKAYLLKLYALLLLIALLLVALLIITGEVEDATAVADSSADRGTPEPGFEDPEPDDPPSQP